MTSKIIILDDEENFAEMIQEILLQAGFRAEVQTSPQAALNLLKDGAYDLVVSDFKMPEMDGDEFLKQARKIRPDLPVIMISGMMNTPELVRVANMGVTLVLEKPVNPRQLIESVGRFAKPVRKEADIVAAQGAPETRLSPSQGGAYPRPLRHLVAESAAMSHFLQQLWESSEEPLVALRVPHGSELDLLAREVSLWKGGDGNPAPCLSWPSIEKLGMANSRESLHLPTEPAVLLIDATFISAGEKTVSWTCGNAPLPTSFRETFPESLGLLLLPESGISAPTGVRSLVFPQMVRRPADVGRLLIDFQIETNRQPAALEPDALRLLLHHDWPGNYTELRACGLEIARLAAARKETLPFQSIRHILLQRHASAPESSEELTARQWLEKAQARFFLGRTPAEQERLLEESEIPKVQVQAQKPLTEQPLLCPELLPQVNGKTV
jgi:DNA-binding NtrC family response regulator